METFDFDLLAGERVVVGGPNGSGKSTFVKSLLGILPLVCGRREVVTKGLRFGYVPQREHLDPIWPLSVLDLVMLGAAPGLRPFRRPDASLAARARALLRRTGLEGLEGAPFRSLSGGQQQRALIARALLPSPEVVVLDEPTNHLDVPGERELLELLFDLHGSFRPSLVVISHRLGPLLSRADRLVFLRGGKVRAGAPAALVADGTLEGFLEEDAVPGRAAP